MGAAILASHVLQEIVEADFPAQHARQARRISMELELDGHESVALVVPDEASGDGGPARARPPDENRSHERHARHDSGGHSAEMRASRKPDYHGGRRERTTRTPPAADQRGSGSSHPGSMDT